MGFGQRTVTLNRGQPTDSTRLHIEIADSGIKVEVVDCRL